MNINPFPLSLSIISVIGGFFVSSSIRANRCTGFVMWCVTNALWICYCYGYTFYEQIPMWTIYFVTSLIGVKNNVQIKEKKTIQL